MKKYLLFILLIYVHFAAYNQTIKGSVIDKDTKKIIPFATVYFSKTTYGTCCDQNGEFKIDISAYSLRSLTISAIGYYSTSIENVSNKENYIIQLTPKVYNINEAQISSKSLARQRKRNLRLFCNEFLGTTKNSRDCKIVNEEDITFNYFNDKDTLKAYANKPLVIENKALGYNITYYLDKFEYYRNSKYVFFAGNLIFEEDSLANNELTNRNRKYAYGGSRKHFLKTLWANELKENHFNIVDSQMKRIKYSDIVVEDKNQNKYLKYSGSLKVYYYNSESTIILSELVCFDKDGSFSQNGIKWKGFMGVKRIADWLPLDYKPNEN